MKNFKNKKLTVFALLGVVVIAIGYALISTNFNITGNLEVGKTEWDVHFENVVLSKDNTVNVETELTQNGTVLTYTGAFVKPGDICSFTVDVVNDGTIDAMISDITFEGLTLEQEEYIEHSLTYLGGEAVDKKETLAVGEKETLLVTVEYKYDIDNSQLLDEAEDLNIQLKIIYVQSNKTGEKSLYRTMAKNAVLDNQASEFVTSPTGVNFKAISSDTNGKGLYVMADTVEDKYPIYYYRGAVTNNNAKFAGFCWKIVRTTSTGGIKLIYNGTPDNDGNCTNTTGSATQIGTSSFNSVYTSPTYSGYMYGEVYTRSTQELSNEYLYGSSFDFTDVDAEVSGDGTYTLTTTTNDYSNLSNYHYTCFNATGECSQINYIYYKDGTTAYYITVKDGKSVADTLSEMMDNKVTSKIKTNIDNWFEYKFQPYFTKKGKVYDNYLEDTVWCNDRSFRNDTSSSSFENSGWNPRGGNTSTYLFYDTVGRRDTTGKLKMDCEYKKDSFTKVETEKGNGLLQYPVGLLTADEIILAGGWKTNNNTYYLYTNQYWWSMSPSNFTANAAMAFFVNSDGFLFADNITNNLGVRPSLSLKHGIKVKKGGDGTATNPYTFVVE